MTVESYAVFPFTGVVPCGGGYGATSGRDHGLAATLHAHARFTGVVQLGGDHYVLMLAGNALGVLQADRGVLRARRLSDLDGSAHFELAACDPVLVMGLCAALSESPTLKGASSLIDVDKLFANLESSAADGFVILERGGEFAVAHLEQGTLRFMSGCASRDHETLREQILLFCYEQPGERTIIQVFSQNITPDPAIARAFAEWLEPKAPPPPFYLTCSRHGKIIERRLCKEPELRIGRDNDNDIVIEQRSVSRHHVTIAWDGMRYKAKDQGSANGTQLNNRRFEMAPLKSGDRLLLGQVEVRFDLAQANAGKQLETLWAAEPMDKAPRGSLLIGGRSVVIDRPVMSLGSAATCDVRIDGLLVKPVQATIVMDNGRYYLSDAGGGPRKVRIGAQRVYGNGAVLQDGDEIFVAGERIVFSETAR